MVLAVNNPPAINTIEVATPDIGGTGFPNLLGSSLYFNGPISLDESIYLAAFSSTTQNIPSGGNWSVNYDTILYQNNWPNFDGGAFYPPLPGQYFIVLQFYFPAGATGGFREFFINAGEDEPADNNCYCQFPNVGTNPLTLTTGGIVTFTQSNGLIFNVFVGQTDSGSLNIGANSSSITDQSTMIYIYYLGGL